jgi:hypothetical protein
MPLTNNSLQEKINNLIEDVRLEMLTGEVSNKSGLQLNAIKKLQYVQDLLSDLDFEAAYRPKDPIDKKMLQIMVEKWERKKDSLCRTYDRETDETKKQFARITINSVRNMISDLKGIIEDHMAPGLEPQSDQKEN